MQTSNAPTLNKRLSPISFATLFQGNFRLDAGQRHQVQCQFLLEGEDVSQASR